MQQRKKVDESQDSRIVSLFKRGFTMAEIASQYGVSRERIRQILAKYGVSGSQGGARVRKEKRKQQIAMERDKKCIARYGCTHKQFKAVCGDWRDGPASPLFAFRKQRQNAATRGVDWKLTFWEWWTIWDESGKWDKRGRGNGTYCMCRLEDKGAYEVGNVYIGSFIQNSVEGKTLALEEPRKKTKLFKMVRAAGGATAVGDALGLPQTYISSLANSGYLPRVWLENGRAELLAKMTCGAYSTDDVRQLAKDAEQMGMAS